MKKQPYNESTWTSLDVIASNILLHTFKQNDEFSIDLWLNREDWILSLMFSNVKEKAEAKENGQVTSWHPSATLLPPPQIYLAPIWMFG